MKREMKVRGFSENEARRERKREQIEGLNAVRELVQTCGTEIEGATQETECKAEAGFRRRYEGCFFGYGPKGFLKRFQGGGIL